MESLEAATRPSIGLPSISHLNSDRIKREDLFHQRKPAPPAMDSPLHPFTPLSHSHSNHLSTSANAVPASLPGLLSPPESRRTSGAETESHRSTAPRLLPSIHEALGSEQSLSSYPPVPPPSVPVAAAPQHHLPLSTNTSPSDLGTRPYPPDPHGSQGPSNPFSRPRSPFAGTSARQPPPPPPSHSRLDSLPRSSFSEPRPPFSTPQHNSKLPALHPIKTAQSPTTSAVQPNTTYSSYPPPPSSTYEATASQSARSMNPPNSYPQYPSNYPSSAPPPSGPNSAYAPSVSTYPSSVSTYPHSTSTYPHSASTYPHSASTYSASPRYPSTSWHDNSEVTRLEEKKINHTSLAPYGDSVKRHLESFDIEASLNEIADGAGHIAEFSKIYRQRAHENQRMGMTPQSMPRLEEVDEMLKQNERVQMSLQRIRDVVHNHHQVSVVETPQDSHYRQMNGYDHETSSNYGDDIKVGGGFAGGDNKSRKRGRAAPPGRCHSCNRAETPEWRRGPDGARTLCNACGLHYAKLTRKMGAKPAMASSNLRPKSIDHGSPAL